MDEQNKKLASTFNVAIRKIEILYRNDAQQQVDVYKQNAMADYKELWELWELRDQNLYLSETNQILR